jgi:hypothetical protein
MELISRPVRRRTLRTLALLLTAAAALAAGVPSFALAAPPAAPPPAKPVPPAVTAAAAEGAKAAPATVAPQPPNGKWLTDKEGRQYFVEKLSKEGLRYIRLNDQTIRTGWGVAVDVVKEDPKFFYYKVYRAQGTGPAPMQAGMTPGDAKKIAASYQVDTPESRGLKFAPFSTGLPTAGQWRNGFDIADMNEDGHPDIVHSPARKSPGVPVIYLGDGKGGWRRWSEARFPPLPYDYGDAAVGDFNGDGHMDIALGVHLKGMMAVLGDGKGHFTEGGKGLDFQIPGKGGDAGGFSSRTVAVVDWNHDGRPDIIAVGEGPRLNLTGRDQARPTQNTESYGVVVYVNQKDGTWVRKDQGTSSHEIFSDALAIGDFNGDGRKDFATGTSIMGRASLVNYGREDGGWSPADVAGLRPGSYVESVDAADLDGDGLDDLVVGYISYEAQTWRSGIDILYAHKDGTWTRRALAMIEGRAAVTALAHGDLDGDGKTDLVALTGEGETWVFRGDGKGFFTRETATGIQPIPGGCKGYHARLADLDGDGKAEIVADFAGESSPMNDPDRCPSGGGIQAWRLAPVTPAAAH